MTVLPNPVLTTNRPIADLGERDRLLVAEIISIFIGAELSSTSPDDQDGGEVVAA